MNEQRPLRRALLVEDDEPLARALTERMRRHGFQVLAVGTAQEARVALEQFDPEAVVIDLVLPDGSGLGLVGQARRRGANPVVLISAHGDLTTVTGAFHAGVSDFLPKPLELNRFDELFSIQGDALADAPSAEFMARAAVTVAALERGRALAASPGPVLILGESGVGKTRLAAHLARFRSGGNSALTTLHAAECSAHDVAHLLELTSSEHARGHGWRGQLPALAIEEVTELSLDAQASLLSATDPERCASGDVRGVDFLTSTVDPANEVAAGRFRSDLWDRLAPRSILLPPLRERVDDVDLLADAFLERVAPGLRLEPEAREALRGHRFPGNVRELLDHLRGAAYRAEGTVRSADLRLPKPLDELCTGPAPEVRVPIGASLDEGRRRIVLATLRHFGGDKVAAANSLGISLKTLYTRLREYRSNGD